MPKKRKYVLNYCLECKIEFLVPYMKNKRHYNCPYCGDSIDVKRERFIWLDKLINKKQPWTQEELDTVKYGIKKGAKYKEIADALNNQRTEQAVRRIAQRIKEAENFKKS